MTDKVQKIREEVERLQNELIQEKEKGFGSDIDDACILELQNVLTYIDSLQEEPVSEDLEKAANEWDAKASFTPFYMTLDDNGNPNGVKQDYTTHAESFKAGAKWQIAKLMTNVIDAQCFGFQGAALFSFRLPADNYLVGSKVKIIAIKED